MQIYVHRDGQQRGPYSLGEVSQCLADGIFAADDLAWHEGAADWAPLAQIEGLALAPEPARTKTPSWVPQRRDDNMTEKTAFFAAPVVRAPIPVPDPIPLPLAEESPVEDGAPKKRQLTPIEKRRRKQKETGKQLMGFGVLVFLCGSGATVLTLFAAVGQGGGGVFIIFVGLLASGVALFVAGYKQYTGT